MTALNREFADRFTDDVIIPEAFAAVRSQAGIRFCLANIDPDGQTTTGITRTSTNISNIADAVENDSRSTIHYTDRGGKSGWDPNLYINIWVGSSRVFAGRSTFPGTVVFAEEEGIVIDPDYVGTIGTAADNIPFHLGKTLVHEIGHYLNLQHVWGRGDGGNCENDDGIDDTPDQLWPYFNCPVGEQTSCGSADMYMNFMDFTNDPCLRLFTRQQVNAMLNALTEHRSALINNGRCQKMVIPESSINIQYLPSLRSIQITYEDMPDQTAQVLLYDFAGRQFLNEHRPAFDRDFLSTSHLGSGVYIVYVVLGETIHQQKVLIAP